MKKRRRKYVADPNSFAKVIALTELFNAAEVCEITVSTRDAFDRLVHGGATPGHLKRLIDTANVTLVRCWGNAPLQEIAQAFVNATKRSWERYERLDKLGLDGPALADVEWGLQLHEELVRKSTPRQMRDAALVVEKLRKEAHE